MLAVFKHDFRRALQLALGTRKARSETERDVCLMWFNNSSIDTLSASILDAIDVLPFGTAWNKKKRNQWVFMIDYFSSDWKKLVSLVSGQALMDIPWVLWGFFSCVSGLMKKKRKSNQFAKLKAYGRRETSSLCVSAGNFGWEVTGISAKKPTSNNHNWYEADHR